MQTFWHSAEKDGSIVLFNCDSIPSTSCIGSRNIGDIGNIGVIQRPIGFRDIGSAGYKDTQDRRDKLERAKLRLSQGIPEATMDYYDRFQRFYNLPNTLTVVLTKENRRIMEDRRYDERIPLWRRKTIEWAIEQGDAIKKCAKAMKTVAEDCATGKERRDNLAARFNSELAPRSWGQVLDRWIANRDDALAEQKKDEEEERRRTRIVTKCRSNGTALQLAEMKIKRLESALADQERLYQSLRKLHSQARLECAEAQMECAEVDRKCAKRNTKRKRNQPVHNSEDDNPYFSGQYRQEIEAADRHNSIQDHQWKTTERDSEDHEEEGSSPAGLRYLPFKCSMCSPACKELATSISKGEPEWKDWYKRHPDLDMPERYKTAPTHTPTKGKNKGDDMAPSGSHHSEDAHTWTLSFSRKESLIRISKRHIKTKDKEEIKRPSARGAKRENALANVDKTEDLDRSAGATAVLLD